MLPLLIISAFIFTSCANKGEESIPQEMGGPSQPGPGGQEGPGGDNGGAGSRCRAAGCFHDSQDKTWEAPTSPVTWLTEWPGTIQLPPHPHRWWILSVLRNTIQGFRETKFSHLFAFKNVYFILMVPSWEWESLSYTTSKLIFTLWKSLSRVQLFATPWIYSPWVPQARIL